MSPKKGKKDEEQITAFSKHDYDTALMIDGVPSSSRLGTEGVDDYDSYARDALHGKYWRSLQQLKPIRFTKSALIFLII